jgi:Ca2+-binding EF-hand superfamily protein
MISSSLRRKSSHILPLAVLAMTLAASTACAQPVFQSSASAEALFGRSTRPDETLAQYLDTRRGEFRAFDVDGDGAITDADLKLQRQINEAGARAMALPTLLQLDLNGDGVITREEVEAFFTGNFIVALFAQKSGELSEVERKQLQMGIDQAMAPDTNNDGRIDAAEMLAYGEKRAIRYSGNPLQWVVLTLDENKDGRVTLDEYLKAAEAAFHKVDSNGDSVLSKDEIDAFRKQSMQAPNPAK